MMETMLLVGSEDVSRAGHNMCQAANEMLRAAMAIEDSFTRNQQFLDRWLQDLERVITKEKAIDAAIKGSAT